MNFDRYCNEIVYLLVAAEQGDLLQKNAKETIKEILKKDLELTAKEKDPSSHMKLTQFLASHCGKVDSSLSIEIDDLIRERKIDTLVDIYQWCSKEIQRKIREVQGIGDLVYTPNGYVRYLNLVRENIISMKKDDNAKIINWLKKQQKSQQRVSDEEDVALAYCNLILVNPQAVKDKEKVVKVVKESSIEISKWLVDVDGYDYNNFDLNWLSRCSGELLKKLAEKPIVCESVAKEVKKQFFSRTLDNQELKIYMKYFAEKAA